MKKLSFLLLFFFKKNNLMEIKKTTLLLFPLPAEASNNNENHQLFEKISIKNTTLSTIVKTEQGKEVFFKGDEDARERERELRYLYGKYENKKINIEKINNPTGYEKGCSGSMLKHLAYKFEDLIPEKNSSISNPVLIFGSGDLDPHDLSINKIGGAYFKMIAACSYANRIKEGKVFSNAADPHFIFPRENALEVLIANDTINKINNETNKIRKIHFVNSKDELDDKINKIITESENNKQLQNSENIKIEPNSFKVESDSSLTEENLFITKYYEKLITLFIISSSNENKKNELDILKMTNPIEIFNSAFNSLQYIDYSQNENTYEEIYLTQVPCFILYALKNNISNKDIVKKIIELMTFQFTPYLENTEILISKTLRNFIKKSQDLIRRNQIDADFNQLIKAILIESLKKLVWTKKEQSKISQEIQEILEKTYFLNKTEIQQILKLNEKDNTYDFSKHTEFFQAVENAIYSGNEDNIKEAVKKIKDFWNTYDFKTSNTLSSEIFNSFNENNSINPGSLSFGPINEQDFLNMVYLISNDEKKILAKELAVIEILININRKLLQKNNQFKLFYITSLVVLHSYKNSLDNDKNNKRRDILVSILQTIFFDNNYIEFSLPELSGLGFFILNTNENLFYEIFSHNTPMIQGKLSYLLSWSIEHTQYYKKNTDTNASLNTNPTNFEENIIKSLKNTIKNYLTPRNSIPVAIINTEKQLSETVTFLKIQYGNVHKQQNKEGALTDQIYDDIIQFFICEFYAQYIIDQLQRELTIMNIRNIFSMVQSLDFILPKLENIQKNQTIDETNIDKTKFIDNLSKIVETLASDLNQKFVSSILKEQVQEIHNRLAEQVNMMKNLSR